MYSFLDLISLAMQKRGSDLHLTTGVPPMCRIDGTLVPITDVKLTPDMIKEIISPIMKPELLRLFEVTGELDFAHSIPQLGRFRINVFKQRNSWAVAARVLNTRIPEPSEIGLSPLIVNLVKKKRGLILVTGPTGSGKSTTLASLIDVVNRNDKRHIITLEDPIEYMHQHKNSIVNQREIGDDTKSFDAALRGALRQDPDVILVGEMRDLDTISIALTAAETGHLVLSTLHTVGAVNTIDRIIDVFPPFQQEQVRTQLADVLECVVSQQLIPREDQPGRVAAFEVMVSNSAVKNMIREGKTYQINSVLLTNQKLGMKIMDDALVDLHVQGKISKENAILFAQDVASVRKRVMI